MLVFRRVSVYAVLARRMVQAERLSGVEAFLPRAFESNHVVRVHVG
jgi:hypothetical protein